MDLITGLGVLAKGVHHMPEFAGKCGMIGKVGMLAFGIFWIVILVHCLQRKFKVDIDKIAWILVLVFVPVVGAFVYLFWTLFWAKKK